ncbi:hypothetical protein [Salinibacter ruber]|uniref:hypothetical protein n=1 Tax=Salinibacter ruber TaxID=146919 RepID=UPI00216A2B64|nr:hypothetical protein [Salinibacter ruber]MCS4195924.1 hypothetical protein [Salinibacter ruber]
MAYDLADLVQALHLPDSAATGLVWAPFMHVARHVSAEYPFTKQLLIVLGQILIFFWRSPSVALFNHP